MGDPLGPLDDGQRALVVTANRSAALHEDLAGVRKPTNPRPGLTPLRACPRDMAPAWRYDGVDHWVNCSGSRRRGAIVLPQTKTVSAESQETGLWLWQGKAPPPQSRSEPLSRRRVILDRIVAAARWTGWIAPAGGLILILLAASLVLRSTALDRRISADTRAALPQPGSMLIATHLLIPQPSIELPDVGLRMPPAASAQMMAQPREGQTVKRRAQRRSPPRVRRTHASFARRGSPVLIPGVLTPPKDQPEGE
jgi:hypothetical protein